MEPDGRQTIYIFGYPKSGNTWLARLLGDVLDSPVASSLAWATTQCVGWEGEERPGQYRIRYGHEVPVDGLGRAVVSDTDTLHWQMLTGEPIAVMYRDPRDIALSAAHHWGRPLEEAIDMMAAGTFPLSFGGGYAPFVRSWIMTQFPYTEMHYEWLADDAELSVRHLLATWRIDADPVRLSDAVKRQSFEERRKWTEENGDTLPYGKEFQLRFLRRGKAGAWRDEMPRETRQRIWALWGDLMQELGYHE